ncbi:HIT-like protein [Basidiobolus meristosporus CBS 931.73]|uniref:HIT-like protein n=1 Tax=Basidiobolus meristosporus CBS 931.73 TaxID=1314790 RepID=A0A1Y1XV69_9FUNG|nr:HIT-like protein [Basidiobolus meristosporus CBS 931.73]|eukprot:ORX89651.1 HIT-like protein [Basidiobolus meristosporus CBS 931.73]
MATSPKNSCIYCSLALEGDRTAGVMYEDERVVAIKEPNPAAEHHFVIIPRKHVPSYNDLTEDDISLLEHMKAVGNNLILNQVGPQQDTLLGFLPKALSSVAHLNMQCVTLPLTCGWVRSLAYKPLVFFTIDDLIGEVKESCYNL